MAPLPGSHQPWTATFTVHSSPQGHCYCWLCGDGDGGFAADPQVPPYWHVLGLDEMAAMVAALIKTCCSFPTSPPGTTPSLQQGPILDHSMNSCPPVPSGSHLALALQSHPAALVKDPSNLHGRCPVLPARGPLSPPPSRVGFQEATCPACCFYSTSALSSSSVSGPRAPGSPLEPLLIWLSPLW